MKSKMSSLSRCSSLMSEATDDSGFGEYDDDTRFSMSTSGKSTATANTRSRNNSFNSNFPGTFERTSSVNSSKMGSVSSSSSKSSSGSEYSSNSYQSHPDGQITNEQLANLVSSQNVDPQTREESNDFSQIFHRMVGRRNSSGLN